MKYLSELEHALAARAKSTTTGQYAVPCNWAPRRQHAKEREVMYVQPYEFYRDAILAVKAAPAQKPKAGRGGVWTNHAVIFNMFVRSTAAFDHDENGALDLPFNSQGWRETGTFLKAIALLPYIKSMGANTIHLLPITSIGSDGNKGTLGSPYAMKNPFALDPNLGEPALGLGAEKEFKAFVEGAHHMGMRVVVEFVFRTSAKDADWVKEHPEWFYWIREAVPDRAPGSRDASAYGPPIFTPEELLEIAAAAKEGDLDHLLPPHAAYRDMFTLPPPSSAVAKAGGKYIGTLADGTKVRIPGAFADWPPDDGQPPWGDVTYLKMYAHPDFDYMAYNTIRMYDRRLAQPGNINTHLWKTMADIIPFYQREFGIDGVMIDMGHALPMELKHDMVRKAREHDHDFAFWDENFSVSDTSLQEGYNAVIGYQWCDQHHPAKFREMLRRFATEGFPLPYFATPESHNTPRAAARPGGTRYSRYAWALSNFLPAIPFIHSGFELGEPFPVNTGLDFTSDDLKSLPAKYLPLFSEFAYSWTGEEQIIEWIAEVSRVRSRFEALITNPSPASFHLPKVENEHILAFARMVEGHAPRLIVIANSDMRSEQEFTLTLKTDRKELIDLLGPTIYRIQALVVKGVLQPGEVVVAEF